MSKSIKIIFTISIVLNVLLLGAMAGQTFHKLGDRKDRLERMTQEMSPEGRHVVAKTMQKAFRDGRDKMRSMRQSKQDVKDILGAEEFDAEAFESAASKMQEMMIKAGDRRIQVTKELAEQLSQEDRKQLAGHFAKGFRGHNPKAVKGKTHNFLKGFEERRKERRERLNANSDEGPKLPDDMPPQP